MSPYNNSMLLNEVLPRLKNAVRTIPKIGCEDDEEIISDCTLQAAKMMESAEKAGQKYSGGNMAYYAVKAARSGRRSYYTGRSDVLSPGCQIDGKVRHEWLDREVEFETGDSGTLHEVVQPLEFDGQESDPAENAARNIDWEAFLDVHSPRHRVVIEALLEGCNMRQAGQRCGLKDSAALMLKRQIAADLVEFFGADVIRRLLHGVSPNWESDMRMSRDRNNQNHGDSFRPQAQPIG